MFRAGSLEQTLAEACEPLFFIIIQSPEKEKSAEALSIVFADFFLSFQVQVWALLSVSLK
jgi:hypothetical protein